MAWINTHTDRTDCIIDCADAEKALRAELGFTQCIIGNDHTPLAWAQSEKGARATFESLCGKGHKPEHLLIITL